MMEGVEIRRPGTPLFEFRNAFVSFEASKSVDGNREIIYNGNDGKLNLLGVFINLFTWRRRLSRSQIIKIKQSKKRITPSLLRFLQLPQRLNILIFSNHHIRSCLEALKEFL